MEFKKGKAKSQFDLASAYYGTAAAAANSENAAGDSPDIAIGATSTNQMPVPAPVVEEPAPKADGNLPETKEPAGGETEPSHRDYDSDGNPQDSVVPAPTADKPVVTREDGMPGYGEGGFGMNLSKPSWPSAQAELRTKRARLNMQSEGTEKAPTEAKLKGDGNDVDEDEDPREPPAPSLLRSFVAGLAKACHEKNGGSGNLDLRIRFENAKVVEVETAGPSTLAETMQCIEDALKASTSAPKDGSLIFSFGL